MSGLDKTQLSISSCVNLSQGPEGCLGCEAFGDVWTYRDQLLCQKIFYRVEILNLGNM